MTPIESLIAHGPTSFVIVTQTPADYDPAGAEDFEPGAKVYWPVVGAFSGVKSEGDNFQAKAHITAEDMPEFFVVGGQTRVGFQEGEYGVAKARPRRRFGEVVGYTLELML